MNNKKGSYWFEMDYIEDVDDYMEEFLDLEEKYKDKFPLQLLAKNTIGCILYQLVKAGFSTQQISLIIKQASQLSNDLMKRVDGSG